MIGQEPNHMPTSNIIIRGSVESIGYIVNSVLSFILIVQTNPDSSLVIPASLEHSTFDFLHRS